MRVILHKKQLSSFTPFHGVVFYIHLLPDLTDAVFVFFQLKASSCIDAYSEFSVLFVLKCKTNNEKNVAQIKVKKIVSD